MMRVATALLAAAAGAAPAALAFAPVSSYSAQTATNLFASSDSNENPHRAVGTFDPLNIAENEVVGEVSSSNSVSLGAMAATTAAAWAATSQAALADSPDWGIFEGVSTVHCFYALRKNILHLLRLISPSKIRLFWVVFVG